MHDGTVRHHSESAKALETAAKEGDTAFIKAHHAAMMEEYQRLLDGLTKNVEQAEERRQKVERLSLQIMRALAATIDAKDTYTNGHSARVAEYAREIDFLSIRLFLLTFR